MTCPICFSNDIHIFTNVCSHSWCKTCHSKLIFHNITSCPMCRHKIYLKKQLNTPEQRFMWTLYGGKVIPRWIFKYNKRSENKSKKYILAY